MDSPAPKKEVFILSAKRSAMGSFLGGLSLFNAHQIASKVIANFSHIKFVEEIIIGNVLQAGLGQGPARQAALNAGFENSVHCYTVNKVCGSGMQAVFNAYDQLYMGKAQSIIAGGMESMSNAPYILNNARQGQKAGHGVLIDHLYRDGLEDPYHQASEGGFKSMGEFADETARQYGFTRKEQEEYAVQTFGNYKAALENDLFGEEIVPIEITDKKGTVVFKTDEQPTKVKPEKFSNLKPAFSTGGTVTAATASPLSDGAAFLLLASGGAAKDMGQKPLAKIIGYAKHSKDPKDFITAPVDAIKKLLQSVGWQMGDVDLFEINEAFCIVPMIVMKELDIDRTKVNVNGGACVMGHPLGCSGARIIVTLVQALRQRGLNRGIAAICIGGGEATAIAVEVC